MRRIITALCFLLAAPAANAQLWSGIIDPARATDWTKAGVIGGIPSASWIQCGATIAAYNGTAAAINTALAGCSANQYVLLGPGTFGLTTQITLAGVSNLVLRGSGPNTTFLVPTAALAGSAMITTSSSSTPSGFVQWTAGYSQAGTTVTVSSVTGVTANQTAVWLDQCEDGLSGDTCSTGTVTDGGGLFNCSILYNPTGPVGCSSDGPGGHYTAFRYQLEMFMVTAVNGSVLTLSAPLRNPNWASGRTPHASYATPVQFTGVENLSIDMTAAGATNSIACINYSNVANSWVYRVRLVNCPDHGIAIKNGIHNTFDQNYIAFSNTSGARHCISSDTVSLDLIQNNILQGYTPCVHTEGPNSGSVIAYNLFINETSPSDAMGEAMRDHSNGSNFNLWEGNIATNWFMDITHGTEPFQTVYRSLHIGWDSCANGQCGGSSAKDFETIPIILSAYARLSNIIGNVFGTVGYHTTYQSIGTGTKDIYLLGQGNNSIANVPTDSVVATTLLRWGNYDTVTAAIRWCGNSSDTGWSTTCASTSEIPTAGPGYPSAVPTKGDTGASMPVMPPSFYLSSKPAWFGTAQWPPIGPDVTSGNLGICSGTINTAGRYNGMPAISSGSGCTLTTAWAGHANAIPALTCFLTVMGGVPDGTTGPLTFNANTCYGAAGGSTVPGGVTISPKTVVVK